MRTNVEACEAAGVACGSPLCVVEVCGDRDDGEFHEEIELAAGCEERLGSPLQLGEDECRDLGRCQLAFTKIHFQNPAGVAGQRKRQQPAFFSYVVNAPAHEALDGVDRAAGIGEKTALGFATDEYPSVGVHRNDRGQQSLARLVRDDERSVVLNDGDQTVGRSEIDTDDSGHCVSQVAGELVLLSRGCGAGLPGYVFPGDGRDQVDYVASLEEALSHGAQRGLPCVVVGSTLGLLVPLAPQRLEPLVVAGEPPFNKPLQTFEAAQRIGRFPAARFADLVELLVEFEDVFQKARRYKARTWSIGEGKPLLGKQVFHPANRIPQCPVRVVQIRGSLEACKPFGRTSVAEVVRMETAAEGAEPTIQLLLFELHASRDSHETEVVTVAPEREDLLAGGAEVIIHGSARAAVSALLERDSARLALH
jgi:hypothetical protein